MIFIVLRISYCFQRAKVQDLDAIHNESKKQEIEWLLFSKSKSTRFRCNSQLRPKELLMLKIVFKEQKYKI